MIASMKTVAGTELQTTPVLPGVSSHLRSALQQRQEVSQSNIEHYISEDGKTYIKLDRNKVKKIKDEEVEDAVKSCIVKIDLTN